MLEVDIVKAKLAGAFGFGAVERDGEVVALWRVTGIGDGGRKSVSWLVRSDDGSMAGFTAWPDPGMERVPPPPEARDTYRRGFGDHLARLLAAIDEMRQGHHPGTQGDMRGPLQYLARDLGFRDGDAQAAVVRDALTEPLREVAARFLDGLDPTYLATFRRHPSLAFEFGRMWGPTADGRSPLPAALAIHPGFPSAIARMHLTEGPAAMRGAIAAGRLPEALGPYVQEQRRDVPRLLATAGRAERALAGRVRRVLDGVDRAWRETGAWTGGQGLAEFLSPPQHDGDWPVAVATMLARFPASWVPADDGQWWAFARLCPVAAQVLRTYGEGTPLDMVLPSGGDWSRLLSRLMAAARVDDPERLCTALAGVNDMVSSYVSQVVLAGCVRDRRDWKVDGDQHHEWLDVAMTMFVGGRSLAKVMEVSADWHSRQHAMRNAVASMPGAHLPDQGWPPGLRDATDGDVEVKVLTTPASLADEGTPGYDADGVGGLDNCVAGYDTDCFEGKCRIVSLRRRLPDGGWERLSLAEVSLERPPAFRVDQHVGHNNGPPPAVAEAVLRRYLDAYRDGTEPYDAADFSPVAPTGGGHGFARACGFDPSVVETRLAVARMWDRFLPGPLRGVDYDGVCRMPWVEPGHRWPAEAPSPAEPEREPDLAMACPF